jgi:hypothetical protein
MFGLHNEKHIYESGDWKLFFPPHFWRLKTSKITYFSNFFNLFDFAFWRYIFAILKKKNAASLRKRLPFLPTRHCRRGPSSAVLCGYPPASVPPPLLRLEIRGIFCSLPLTCTLSVLQPHASQVLRFLLQSQVPVVRKLWCSTLQFDFSDPSIIDIGFVSSDPSFLKLFFRFVFGSLFPSNFIWAVAEM